MFTPQNVDLLVVDDDAEFRATVVRRFQRRGFQIQEAESGEAALGEAQRRQFNVALFDMVMPGMSGIELLKKMKEDNSECEVIMLTGQGTIETAVEAMKYGAFDYLTKPFPLADLELLIEKAYRHNVLKKENQQLKEVIKRTSTHPKMIGQSAAMKEVFHLIKRAGPTDKAILIQGESGTGKELVAQALHEESSRADKPLVIINCAALPEPLLESELFGHEKGAFTGAIATKQGLFEIADGGTLLIDEIGELAGSLQAKLLRVLENGTMRRVGSVKERRLNVRLLAATNRDMEKEIAAGRFREDLYYRINVMSLMLPPLRKRTGDIPPLINHIIGEGWEVDSAAMKVLEAYHWPGNIRQLQNCLERAKILSDNGKISVENLPPEVIANKQNNTGGAGEHLTDDLASIQRSHIVEVLQRERGNKARSARALGINRRSLYRLIEKYTIKPEEVK